jgi:hypothetical protein
MTTIEMKCGKYERVCTLRLKTALFTSLSSRAKMMGSGHPQTSPYILSSRVLRMIRQAKKPLKKFSKCRYQGSAQELAQNPLTKL